MRLLHWLQRRMLWLLLATYLTGAIVPRLGTAMRDVSAGTLRLPVGGAVRLTLPTLMLGFLLVVAGLGTDLAQLRRTTRRFAVLLAGLAANSIYPVVFAVAAAGALLTWHDSDEAQSILVGLAMIGAMPIAGSSTAWAQNADGNLGLSLGLVLGSTVLSPLLTPLGLHAIGAITHGDYSEDLHELATQGSGAFIAFAVVAPSILGLSLRALLGARRVARVLPALKALNLIDLLLLNYSNAAAALPQILHSPDWDFLAVTATITALMCAGAFATGWLLARLFHSERRDQIALIFGLGMNNNGTGLVLASVALADHALVLVPIIFYNLVQQIVAGLVDHRTRRRSAAT
jgi:BASS family bile acid:Na+ symporter